MVDNIWRGMLLVFFCMVCITLLFGILLMVIRLFPFVLLVVVIGAIIGIVATALGKDLSDYV